MRLENSSATCLNHVMMERPWIGSELELGSELGSSDAIIPHDHLTRRDASPDAACFIHGTCKFSQPLPKKGNIEHYATCLGQRPV